MLLLLLQRAAGCKPSSYRFFDVGVPNALSVGEPATIVAFTIGIVNPFPRFRAREGVGFVSLMPLAVFYFTFISITRFRTVFPSPSRAERLRT